jgi:two-component system sensor histidine kinase MprB
MSLRVRITLVVVVIVAAVVAVVGERVYSAADSELTEEVDLDLRNRVATFVNPRSRGIELRAFIGADPTAGRRGPGGLVDDSDPTEALRAAASREIYARLVDRNGSELLALGGAFTGGLDTSAFPQFGQRAKLSGGSIGPDRARVITVAVGDDLFLQMARSMDELDQSLDGLRIRILLISLVALVAAGAAAWFLAGASLQPISRLARAAERVAQTGDLEHPVDGRGNTEVGRLAESFNTMLSALGASRLQQHRLVMDASHELRTPLASLQTNIDLLRSGREIPDEVRRDIINALGAEIDELGALVAELVDLAADNRGSETPQRMALVDVVIPVVERQQRRTGSSVTVDVVTEAEVEVRPEAMSRAVRNLLENAAKFAPADSPIRVVVDGGKVTVHDAGSGIPERERLAVFDRFYRVESTRAMPGSGLGLAIVKQVAEQHDGRAYAEASPDGGAAVSIEIPTVPPPS